MTETARRPPRIADDPEQTKIINKNLDLLAEFLPVVANAVEPPNGSTLMLLPDDDPEQTAANIELGLRAIERGANVYFRHVHRRDQAPGPGPEAQESAG